MGVTEFSLPTYGYSDGWSARPHVEVDQDGYHYIIMERGNELKHIAMRDEDSLLYHVFCDITSVLASEYELTHRTENQDSREVQFTHQNELLELLSPAWAAKQRDETGKIIEEYPYVDSSETREQGQLLSRIGRIFGVFAAPPGTSIAARSLPASCAAETETIWEVMEPFEMQSGLSAPWGGAPGLGVQYLLPRPIETLMRMGFVRCLRSGPIDNRSRWAKFFSRGEKRDRQK